MSLPENELSLVSKTELYPVLHSMPPQRFETLNGSMDNMHWKQTEIIV